MASSSVANLFSFFTSPKPPQIKAPAPSQLPLPAVSSSSSSSRSKNGLAAEFQGLSLSTADNQLFPIPSSTVSSSELMSVICPSLTYNNTLFFSSSYNVQVIVEDNEPEEKLVGRFRREVMRAGVIQESKRRRYFENKQEEKKRRTRDAAKRNRRRRTPFTRGGPMDKQETSNVKKEEEDEDNWELPDDAFPY